MPAVLQAGVQWITIVPIVSTAEGVCADALTLWSPLPPAQSNSQVGVRVLSSFVFQLSVFQLALLNCSLSLSVCPTPLHRLPEKGSALKNRQPSLCIAHTHIPPSVERTSTRFSDTYCRYQQEQPDYLTNCQNVYTSTCFTRGNESPRFAAYVDYPYSSDCQSVTTYCTPHSMEYKAPMAAGETGNTSPIVLCKSFDRG